MAAVCSSFCSDRAPDWWSGGREFKSHIAIVHLEPLDGELAVAFHRAVMWEIIGAIGVPVVIVAIIILYKMGFRGGGGD